MSLESIAKEVKVCKKCSLHKNRTNAVPGFGSSAADIMFIGEGPGKHEDLQGIPFVGAAGKYLDKLLEMINLKREDVFIANVVKCRPPNNRDPLPEEVKACWPYLEAQIEAINPAIIITLGRHSMNRFITGKSISKVHGKAFRKAGRVFYPVYHPAAALYRGALRVDIEADFKRIPALVKKVRANPAPANRSLVEDPADKPRQGSLL